MSTSSNNSNYIKLSTMMFLQFFTWGAWFATLFLVLGKYGAEGSFIAKSYGTAPIAAIAAPLFLGLIADRFFPSEKVMGVLMLIGGACMLMVPSTLDAKNYDLVYWLFLGHMLCYMPTLGLGNNISFSNLHRDTFPKVRVWGTIGWIAAGLLAGAQGWSDSLNLFWMAGISAVALGFFCFCLPNTPAPLAGKPIDMRSIFMVDAFKLLTKPAYLVFIICSTLICIPLAYYFLNTSGYLANMGFTQPASTMTLGQMSEIFFMLLIPFFFRKLGVKWMILVGMGAWVLRYLLFAYGADQQIVWMIFAGILLHGICYDFFFVTGFMYTDKVAPKAARGQAQSMLVFFTQGIGMYIGYQVAGTKFAPVKADSDALGAAIGAGREAQELTFWQKLGNMFSVDMPDSVDTGILEKASALWKTYWIYPAIMAGIVAVLFFICFWDKSADGDSTDEQDA